MHPTYRLHTIATGRAAVSLKTNRPFQEPDLAGRRLPPLGECVPLTRVSRDERVFLVACPALQLGFAFLGG